MRKVEVEFNDKVALLGRVVGVRHAFTSYCLLVARAASNKYMHVLTLMSTFGHVAAANS